MNKPTLLILTVLCLSACASLPTPAATAPEAVPEKATQTPPSAIPYPTLSSQNQIDQLGIQVARLEQQLEHLQTRIQQLERASAGNTRTTRRPQANTATAHEWEPQSTTQPASNARTASNLSQAQQLYQRGDYHSTIHLLKYADSGGNGSDIDRQSMFLLLQAQQHLANCESVINIGNRYVSRFRASTQASEALFSVGQCQYRLQQKDVARDTWRKLIQTYPDSAAAKRAYRQLNAR